MSRPSGRCSRDWLHGLAARISGGQALGLLAVVLAIAALWAPLQWIARRVIARDPAAARRAVCAARWRPPGRSWCSPACRCSRWRRSLMRSTCSTFPIRGCKARSTRCSTDSGWIVLSNAWVAACWRRASELALVRSRRPRRRAAASPLALGRGDSGGRTAAGAGRRTPSPRSISRWPRARRRRRPRRDRMARTLRLVAGPIPAVAPGAPPRDPGRPARTLAWALVALILGGVARRLHRASATYLVDQAMLVAARDARSISPTPSCRRACERAAAAGRGTAKG